MALHTSQDRGHVFWKALGFTEESVEHLERRLAIDETTDRAATSAGQMTRLPGFMNHKRCTPCLVQIE